MFKILKKSSLNEYVTHMVLDAPDIAKKALPGQFVILRVDEFGERIPLTIFNANKVTGSIEIIYQKVGVSTYKLDSKNENDYILDLVGPLGKPTNLSGYKRAILVSGGVGTAVAYPIAKGLFENGCSVETILGFRNKNLIILHSEMSNVSCKLDTVTNDGSNGFKGLVTDVLNEKLSKNSDYDVVISVGPLIMMREVNKIACEYKIKSIVSMTAIMIDGTGMCGGCRINVDGKVKFACIDGPDFDGSKVDFDNAMDRSRTFEFEENLEREKYCKLFEGV